MSAHGSFDPTRRLTLPGDLKSVRRPRRRVLQRSERQAPDMPLKTLIVDDEPIARKILREELELIDNVEVIGEAADGVAALAKIGSDQPYLVLLDLQMPAMGGLDVVRQLKQSKHAPVIVIVTAYDQHALEAFEAGAIDYLLKPVGQVRLLQAVERARRVTGRQAMERIAQVQGPAGQQEESWAKSGKSISCSAPTRSMPFKPMAIWSGLSRPSENTWPRRP